MKTIEEIKSTPKTVMKKPELLAPAGNLEKLKIAVHYGADAVFFRWSRIWITFKC